MVWSGHRRRRVSRPCTWAAFVTDSVVEGLTWPSCYGSTAAQVPPQQRLVQLPRPCPLTSTSPSPRSSWRPRRQPSPMRPEEAAAAFSGGRLWLARYRAGLTILVTGLEIANEGIAPFGHSQGARSVVILGADKADAACSRFDAAHELGHLVCHPDADPVGSRSSRPTHSRPSC